MTVVWRLDKATRSQRDSFSGVGAAMEGGRWNRPGTRVVYAAQTLSLAAIEKFVHLGDESRPLSFVSYRIEIPTGVRMESIELRDLPRDWKAVPAPRSTMDIGTDWAKEGRSAVLRLPSVVIETEHNVLLNPLHADFRRLHVTRPTPFRFDLRMRRIIS